MRHWGYVRNFEHTLRGLAARGHAVELLLAPTGKGSDSHSRVLGRMLEEHPNLSCTTLDLRSSDPWVLLGEQLRAARDYLRYLEPAMAGSGKARTRARRNAPPWARRLAEGRIGRSPRARALLDRVLRAAADAVPPGRDIVELLAEHRPDLVLVTPLISTFRQPEFVQAAHALGIPAAVCVTSWDNLTTKGLVHGVPEVLAVWNETQRTEAVELHGLPREIVAVTGAHTYDHWFGWRPSRERAAFLAEVGLPGDRPYLLYLCSSGFIAGAGDELETVAEWIAGLRGRPEPGVAGIGVLVRPHPANAAYWEEIDPAERFGPGVAVWPLHDSDPDDDRSRSDYFDSIFHAAAVVGVNTSAMIESAIVGRPVLSIARPEFRDTQERSIHFSYLRSVGGGLVTFAEDADEHARQVAAIVAGRWDDGGRREAFLAEFIRPHGLGVAAAPAMLQALEDAAARPVRAPRPSPGTRLLRVALRPVARLAGARDPRVKSRRRRGFWRLRSAQRS